MAARLYLREGANKGATEGAGELERLERECEGLTASGYRDKTPERSIQSSIGASCSLTSATKACSAIVEARRILLPALAESIATSSSLGVTRMEASDEKGSLSVELIFLGWDKVG